MWREELIERSWLVLGDLKKFADFVVIGGWGVYFWAKKLKSRDIDVYINEENFYRLQSELQQRNLVDINASLLKKLLEKYDKKRTLLGLIKRVIVESRMEYKFLGLTYQREGVRLREHFEELLK